MSGNQFIPHISGWIDIVFPSLAFFVLLPYFFWETLFVIALVLLLVCVLFSFILKASRGTKFVFISLPFGLILLFLGIYPDFATEEYLGAKQRVSFFAVGGQTLLAWAGGANTVRNDALSLFSQPTSDEGYVDHEVWTNSLKRLQAYEVRIDRETDSVIIDILSPPYFDTDYFGYLITEGEEPEPSVLQSNGHRLWKLDEGIYFFQLW